MSFNFTKCQKMSFLILQNAKKCQVIIKNKDDEMDDEDEG